MNKIKHSKLKNSGILFELLVRTITSDTLNGKESPAKDILKEYFVKTELGKEYKLYDYLIKKNNLTESKANMVINTVLESYNKLNKKSISRQKYNLIKEIKKHYDLDEFFKHKLNDYKVQAAIYTLLELKSNSVDNIEQEITNKYTILEHLSSSKLTDKKNNILINEFSQYDKDLRILTYKILLEKFNEKYDGLSSPQKNILKELIMSLDNTPKLKEFYNNEIKSIKTTLLSLNENMKDKVVKIKIDEILNILQPKDKLCKVKDDDLINLLQYHDLINELSQVNV
jgi:hypothetical protein